MARKLRRALAQKVKYSKHGRRFFTQYDMAEIKRLQAIQNSQVNRGEMEDGSTHHVSVCQCGAEGCFGILRRN